MKAPLVAGALRLVGVLLDIAADLLDPPQLEAKAEVTTEAEASLPMPDPFTDETREFLAVHAAKTILPPAPEPKPPALAGSAARRYADARRT